MTAPSLDVRLAHRRFLPAVIALFVLSGCAALIYEIIWFQLLELVIGSSAVSIGVLLATYMGGMCLGSLLLPRHISTTRHPLRLYAALELGIGVSAVVVVLAIPYVGGLYTAIAGHGLGGLVIRGAVCGACLLVPTMLMGATLPFVSRWVGSAAQGMSWVGFLYGGNTAGAVFGCLLAGFYLLRVDNMLTATCVAAALNAVIAGVAWAVASRSPHEAPVAESELPKAVIASGAWPVYVAIGLSGLCALGAEVVWTRLLGLMLGASVYTFSIILAVFLVGLGIGSSVGSYLARGSVRPWMALAWCQLLQVAGIAWTAYMIARALPYWPINPSLAPSPWFNFQLDVARCMCAVLPPALLWGASFPLALAAVASRGGDPGRLVGGVYAANTVGGIIGALALSLFAIPHIGTQDSQRTLIVLSVVSALVLFGPASGLLGARLRTSLSLPAMGAVQSVAITLALFLAIGLGESVSDVPPGIVAYGRFFLTHDEPTYLYVGEGINSSIAVSQLANGVRNFHVAGKIEASTEPQDMRLQRMLGHLSALLEPHPKSVLVVGFGAGVTAGTFVTYPPSEVGRIVICELEPLIPKVVSTYFGAENYNVLNDPRVEVVYDDARHYILTSHDKFDIITSDPIHPWVKGAATLYTDEYFELVKRHLTPGGLISQWVPLYESTPEVVKSELATFFNVFPDGAVWTNNMDGQGYDVVVTGVNGPPAINIDAIQDRLDRPDYDRVRESLESVGFTSTLALLGTFGGQAADLRPWYAVAPINHDRDLRLQYLAGMGLNLYENATIYDDMEAYRRFPPNLFVGAPDHVAALAAQIGSPG
ncbi:MAG TPA: fused MFS/spermidine synthase, partial [Gemmatimonadaceae bacterium]|nr:fused MFS/spermidine synthase [Gemmatimonadaceae bacterium]